ncbi:hypothetical protein [Acinetobacter bereziniae]|uniref:hypothetical protein n=1 Tax=Acinetobacter bereziniae TaxID=106648 RepID=UPI0015DAB50A|nr:hypothetical protein [Acinetobacter bereziniae]
MLVKIDDERFVNPAHVSAVRIRKISETKYSVYISINNLDNESIITVNCETLKGAETIVDLLNI